MSIKNDFGAFSLCAIWLMKLTFGLNNRRMHLEATLQLQALFLRNNFSDIFIVQGQEESFLFYLVFPPFPTSYVEFECFYHAYFLKD
jgi:hypothetical protein